MSEFVFKFIISFLSLVLSLFYYTNFKFFKKSNKKRMLKINKMEMVDFSKNPRFHIHENTPQYQERMKIYEEGHRNKSCPPILYDIIVNL